MAKVSAINRSSLAVSIAAELPAAAAAAALRWGGGQMPPFDKMSTAWAQEVDVFYTKKLRWQLQRSLKAKIIYVYIYNMNHHDRSLQNSMHFM